MRRIQDKARLAFFATGVLIFVASSIAQNSTEQPLSPGNNLRGTVLLQSTRAGIENVHLVLIGLNSKLPRNASADEAARSVANLLQSQSNFLSSPDFTKGLFAGIAARRGISSDLLLPISIFSQVSDIDGEF